MIHFYKLAINDIRRETSECVSISFEVSAELKELFSFSPGQYLTLKTIINGKEIRRSYSICSSPFDNELRIAVKKTGKGIFSNYANNTLRKGDVIEVMPPLGKFYPYLNKIHKKKYVALVAGSGITPVLSIIKTILLTEPESIFTLVYGNKKIQSIIFKNALDDLKNSFMHRLAIVHVLSRQVMDSPLNEGRIDAEKCRLLFSKLIDPLAIDEFFICGPEEMTHTVKDFLISKGVENRRIRFELFSTHENTQALKQDTNTPLTAEEVSSISLKLDGASFDFELDYYGESILEAALNKGADLPFSCKSGVCCSCKARLIEGKVEMDVNYGLEPEEVEIGYILTCQSHPRSKKLVVDFDIK